MNIANGEIKKLTEEIAPKEKVATPPVQKVTPPLEPITEHSDEADKSIPTTKPGKRLKPYGNEIAIYHPLEILSLCNIMQFQIIAQTDPFKLVPEESKLDDVNSEGNHKKPNKGR